eukprot:gnl/TRDRNA2_/TRDRNA2_38733_c0_seq1.p1 gnl/TRDRNA2_/TRDRNA2_38733_c0~~gnl/TRDRNA2_/TRDRNA2_38733_c0_seq1.p1  ORF type:complete len:352 (-),score=54.81 gnl/TRDRNA2_/TRDRNA2_38733_c0_seq1:117-1067(-)
MEEEQREEERSAEVTRSPQRPLPCNSGVGPAAGPTFSESPKLPVGPRYSGFDPMQGATGLPLPSQWRAGHCGMVQALRRSAPERHGAGSSEAPATTQSLRASSPAAPLEPVPPQGPRGPRRPACNAPSCRGHPRRRGPDAFGACWNSRSEGGRSASCAGAVGDGKMSPEKGARRSASCDGAANVEKTLPQQAAAAASAIAPGSPEAKNGDAAALAKQKAVMALQKLFFEELAKGQDPNGAAARALVRLNEAVAQKADAAPETPAPTYPLCGGSRGGGPCGIERPMAPVPPTAPRRKEGSGPRRHHPGQEIRISVGN